MGYIITINKVIAGCSLVLSLIYLLGCCWEFGSIMHRSNSSSVLQQNHSHDLSMSETNLISETNSNNGTTPDESHDGIWIEFDKMTDKFKIMIIICLWGSIVGLLLQSISSAVILFSPRGKTANRSKYWVGVLFITFIILLITFFVPCTHSRDEDKFLSVEEFNSELKKGFKNQTAQGLFDFIRRDLHLYYIMIFFDLCFLFIGMITVSCLLRFHEQQEEAFYAEISNRYR